MIFFGSSLCQTCEDGARSGTTDPAATDTAEEMGLEDIERLILQTGRARDYLAAYNARSDTPAHSIFLMSGTDQTLVPPDPERVEPFRAFLTEQARAARDAGPPADDPAARPGVVHRDTRVPAACTACRGQCCFTGLENHAFLDAEAMRAPMVRDSGMSAQDIVDFYISHLPDRHVEGSCLYHTDTGCALPRWSRADLCGSYLCDEVTRFLDATEALCADHVHLVVAETGDGPVDAVLHCPMQPVPADALRRR